MKDAKSGSGPDFPVILAHGLWAPGLVMTPLAIRLEREGFRCHGFSYGGRSRPLEAHAERLVRFARTIGRAHFVGHSLGGLVMLSALQSDASIAVGRVVLLGTPARGCLSGQRLARRAHGRWLLGESEKLWREGIEARWTRPEPLGVIAGTMPFGLGRIIGRLPGPNDGVVRVEETAVDGMTECMVLPVSHSAMLISSRVEKNVAAFLNDGRFSANPL
jgi:pimeloyl-ACP methyl ester carboxylesterase